MSATNPNLEASEEFLYGAATSATMPAPAPKKSPEYARLAVENLEHIPNDLEVRPQWIVWREDPPSSPLAKAKKTPLCPHTLRGTGWNEPQNGTSFETAVAVYQQNPTLTGIGYVFSKDDPYVGVDLDKCRNIETGEIQPWALAQVQQFDSYTEISPSQTGLKIIVRGSLVGKENHFTVDGHEVEIYEKGRYFALTGQQLSGTPNVIHDRQQQIDSIVPNEPPQTPAGLVIPRAEDAVAHIVDAIPDAELLARIERSKQGPKFKQLMGGSTAGYAGYFAASGALCWILAAWTRCNPERIDRIYRLSSLFTGWDAWWDDRSYSGNRTRAEVTIASSCALAAQGWMYEPPAKPAQRLAETFVEVVPEEESAAAPVVASLVRPTIDETMFYGLAGEIIKKLEPHSEAHPVGMLLEFLVSFGNMMGRQPFYQIDDTRHYTNEFMVKVGESSRARKGTGKNRIRAVMNCVDPAWVKTRCASGFGSGESIIHFIRDQKTEWVVDKRTHEGKHVVVDPGVDDKRACVNMGEFKGVLAVCNRADNLLSVVLRDGWDGAPLKNIVKNNPAGCEAGLVSLMADTTRWDLSADLSDADRNNGFANRFLWCYVYRTQQLPHGGGDMHWDAEAPRLRAAVDAARETYRVFMDKPASDYWARTLYPKLEREMPGLVGALTSRASAHTTRLALIYALLDCADHIQVPHLKAAAALWQYCEDSVQTIFGELLTKNQTKIMDFLRAVGSANKTRFLEDCFKRNVSGKSIQQDLDWLVGNGKITVKTVEGIALYSLVKRDS